MILVVGMVLSTAGAAQTAPQQVAETLLSDGWAQVPCVEAFAALPDINWDAANQAELAGQAVCLHSPSFDAQLFKTTVDSLSDAPTEWQEIPGVVLTGTVQVQGVSVYLLGLPATGNLMVTLQDL